jgi:hypothetical protein
MGIDFQTQSDLAIAMGILAALQKEVEDSFEAIDAQPNLSTEDEMGQQLQRCLKCAERNHWLLLRVLGIKEELVGRMYMSRLACKSNELKLSGMMADIRRAKLSIRDKLKELEIRRLAIRSRLRPFEDHLHLEEEDLHILRNGLEVLQKESFDLWSELSAYSVPSK